MGQTRFLPEVIPAMAGCHGSGTTVRPRGDGRLRVAIVGQPNVGKSVLFNALTGGRATVANYPGTTVELMYGTGRGPHGDVLVVDTPGMYSLVPTTEEERVAQRFLFIDPPDIVVHVVDAKHLGRMLPMTIELVEAGFATVLVVNFMDEAERLGIHVDAAGLAAVLGVPVVLAALREGRGVDAVWQAIAQLRTQAPCQPSHPVTYPPPVEEAIASLVGWLPAEGPLTPRGQALRLLTGDTTRGTGDLSPEIAERVADVVERTRARLGQPLSYVIARARQQVADQLVARYVRGPQHVAGYVQKVDQLLLHPLGGIPVLLLVLWLMYELVGVIAAQVVVDWLETDIFEARVNPWVDALLARWVPWPVVRELFGGEYGVVTLGVRYAVAIILPVVGAFFLVFAVLEDSGYLPRLALLVDRLFKRIGLNGRAVIPMVLGLGCDTMATVVTRTLETRRERVLATLLLALAIPCSAQLGVMLGLLGGQPVLLAIWAGVVSGVFLLVGYLAARLLPGTPPAFYVELPPLRWPTLSGVLVKTYARVEWYFREVLPLFVLASVLIWAGRLTGAFDALLRGLTPLVRWLGLPDEAAVALLFGFFRRDYGAAGLFDLRDHLSPRQLVVAATTLTLFVPCIAQFAVMWKERGPRTALAIVAFIFPVAFLVGGALFRVLAWAGIP